MNGLARTNGYARSNGYAGTPTRGMLPLSTAFDRLFESAFTPVAGAGTHPDVKANIWETDEAYQIALLMPGADPESIEVTALGKTITVAGSQASPQPEGSKAIWQEFAAGQFRRQFGLPMEVDSEHIEAAYQNGILLLKAPKAEHAKPRQIKIQTV